jgi:SNF family Na+-dependent transporter
LISLVGYLAVIVWTFIYFVPELTDIMGTEFSNTIDESLVARGARWESLSFVRLAIIVVIAFILLTGLSKPATRSS